MNQKPKWKREISAGGVVYKKEKDKIFILLIRPSGETKNKEKKWTFPKGHLDGQKPEEAAVREVKEEAGVEARIIKNLGSIKYSYQWEEESIFKIVTFYLMEYVSGDPENHDHEVVDVKWVEIGKTEKSLSYKGDKEMLGKAKEKLT